MLFLTCSWRFLISKNLEQLLRNSNWKKILGFRNMQEKLGKNISWNSSRTGLAGSYINYLKAMRSLWTNAVSHHSLNDSKGKYTFKTLNSFWTILLFDNISFLIQFSGKEEQEIWSSLLSSLLLRKSKFYFDRWSTGYLISNCQK